MRSNSFPMNSRFIFAVLATAVFSLPLAAQTINLTLQDVTPNSPTVTWKYVPDFLQENTYVGALRFTDAASTNYNLFCIDLAQNVSFGGNYTFQFTAVQDAPVTSSSGTPMGATKTDRLSLLYGSVFGSNISGYTPLTTLNTAAKLQGFQLAVWNIVFDSVFDWSVTNNDGDFFVTSSDAGSTAAIAEANAFLDTVQANVASGGGTRMSLIALTDSTAQREIQDQLVPQDLMTSVPEPSAYAFVVGCCVLAGAFFRRRERAA